MEFVSAPSSVLFSLRIINISNYSYSEEKKNSSNRVSSHDLQSVDCYGPNISTAE